MNLPILKRKLLSLRSIENQYNLLVQIDWLAGICTCTILGICIVGELRWFIFAILLVLNLGLGIITVRKYTKMMKEIISRR